MAHFGNQRNHKTPGLLHLLQLHHAVKQAARQCFSSIFRKSCSKQKEEGMGAVKKGHFPVFAVNGGEPKKFVVPLSYLGHPRFLSLLEAAAEEFGLDQPGALFIPCKATDIQAMLLESKSFH